MVSRQEAVKRRDCRADLAASLSCVLVGHRVDNFDPAHNIFHPLSNPCDPQGS